MRHSKRWSNSFLSTLCHFLLIFLSLQKIQAARQNPLKDPKICGRPQCDLLTKKFGYSDLAYSYDYTINLRTEFSGTGQNASDLFLKANVDLLFPKPCEGFMRINDVKLWKNEESATKKQSATTSSEEDSTTDKSFDDYYGEFAVSSTSSDNDNLDLTNLHPKSNDLETSLKAHILRFSFVDGLIGEVCPHDQESNWVLNFKKGILSSFQNTMMRFDVDFNTTETDVSGVCNVQYSLESTDDVFVTIRKVKDVPTCRNRYATHSILQTTPYTFRDEKTIWPILNSESFCNFTIDNNMYRDITCFERHQLIPFSNVSTGAVTTTKTRFELKSEESYSMSEFLAENNEPIGKRSTLLFDHTPAVKPTHGEIKAARNLLKEMCSIGFPNIQREFINSFTNFLQTAKSLDYKALTQLLARSASICENGKNHVLESLPYIGSTASYQLMRDQIISNAIEKNLALSWMHTLSLIQRPDEETLETFYTILEFSRKKIDPEYTLGASAVIHSYCKHNQDCGANAKIKAIINLLETEFLSLFNMFKGERRTRERMIIILKGLGNIGVISEQFAEQLKEIINENIAPVEVRLHSVFAFRRVNCFKYRPFFLETYANYSINSEIRIGSYLQAMRCPDYNAINLIKITLENEKINQVGSYVWSHLKNLAKSSSPVRIEAQGLLLNDDLSDKFKLDIRKFSRNYEHSLFFDEYNFGTTTDMNLIFGIDSYIPRMTTLNFTADLFGQSINFFEFSLRAEGFEELVASAFGPKGPLNRNVFKKKLSFLRKWLGSESSEEDDTLENLFNIDNLRLKRGAAKHQQTPPSTTIENEDNYDIIDMNKDFDDFEPNNSFRNKRSLQTAPALKRKADSFGYKLKYNYNNPRAEIGLRVFGNDLQFITIEGIAEMFALAKEFDPFYRAKEILSGNEVIYTKSRVFLDASYNVPLAIGLPLSINAFGASSVDLRVAGNLERFDSTSDWFFNIEGKFKPSVSVDAIVTMSSDMFYATSGIKVKSNLYSNSEVEAQLKVRGKSLVSFSFNLPKDTNEIFSARSELLVMDMERDIPQTGIEHRQFNSTCTWPVLDNAIGLKICSYFSVPDLSKESQKTYPGLLLSGPLNFSVVLTKSDSSAKRFDFEYKWNQVNNDSDWSLVFNTPGSEIKRELITNVSTTPNAFNASVSFENGNSTASAGCNYDGNPDDQKLDIFFNTNGNRSLDLNMELKRWQQNHVWVYEPNMLLVVNGVNITGLKGRVRISEKSGITQNDIKLSFETKKLQAIIQGNVIQSEITTSTNMAVNYRFQVNKIETINLEGKLINYSDKSKTEYRGNVKLRTSAYPKLNFASNATWLTLQGHTEGIVTYNNAPNLIDPDYTSFVRLEFARSFSDESVWEGSRTRASFEVKVPQSKVDFRLLAKHEERMKNGTEHNVLVALRYAPEREATSIFSVHFPRRNLFAIDAYMNISIPDFDSCTTRLKIYEKTPKDYLINLNGTWFTGHSISIKSSYKDKSSRVQALHQMKIIVESPSFDITSLNIVYRRNQLLIFGDFQAKYGQDPYAFGFQFNSNPNNKNSNAELRLKVKEREYSINAKLLSEQPKLLQVEFHLDKLRDIHIKTSVLSLDKRKELSLELKWDANRDPSQRLGLLIEYNKPEANKYYGNLMVTYPERTISGGFEAFTGGPEFYGTARASWSITETITLHYKAGILPGKNIHNWIHIEVNTPFAGWSKNSIQSGVFNAGNLILANTSLLWANDQRFMVGFKSDYDFTNEITSFDVRFNINSTIPDIPTINIKVKHLQDLKKLDTDLDLRYTNLNYTLNIYSIRSIWDVYHDENVQNVTGTVLLISPFEGYRKGGLAAKFSLNDQRTISGAVSLNFDIRQFTLAMEGYARKFTDNMLTINITTPLEKFRNINGRIGLNEHRRHAVAEVSTNTAALGAEVLFDVISLMNFDVKLSGATPIEGFTQAALFAKIKPDTLDLRGMWNHTTLGFTGVWRMNQLTDFQYSYYVYTPLSGFEENGFIAHFIKRNIFLLNLYGKLSHYKLGIRVDGKPKTKLLNQLGTNKIELEFDEDFQPPKENDMDDYDINDDEYDDYLSYLIDFQVDTLIWPTIEGDVDIQEIMDYYLVLGNLQLPQGRLDVKNRLYFPDYLNAINVLNINTPFKMCKQIKSIVEFHIDLNYNYFYDKIRIIVTNETDYKAEVGLEVNYTKVVDTLLPKQHLVKLNVRTPYELLDEINIEAKLELEDNIYKGNITSVTKKTVVSLAASIETEDNFLETSVGILLNTTVIPHYSCRGYFKKDFSEIDNTIDIQFEVLDNAVLNRLQIECQWNNNTNNIINANGKFKTTMLPLKEIKSSILLTRGPNVQLNFDMNLINQNDYRIDYGTRASKKNDVFNVEIWTPMKDFRNISMHGTMIRNPTNPKEYRVNGELYRNLVTYALRGVIKMSEYYPTDARLRLQPKTGGAEGVVELSITENYKKGKGYNIQFNAIEQGKMCHINGGFAKSEANGLDFSLLIESSEPEIKRINVQGQIKQNDKNRVIGDLLVETPWKQLGVESVKLHSDVEVKNNGGKIEGEYQISKYIGRGSCAWSWLFAENMQLILESYMVRANAYPRIVHASVKYLNPNKSYLRLLTGGKLSVDSKWNLEVNGSLNYRSADDLQFGVVTKLPLPVGDTHHITARYRGNMITQQGKDPNIFVETKYQSEDAKQWFMSRISYRNVTDLQGLARAEWGVDKDIDVVEGDFQILRKPKVRREFYAKLLTPMYKQENTFFMNGFYDYINSGYHNLACSINYPNSRRLGELDISFQTISNMYGFINSTTPITNVTWFRGDFNFSSYNGENYRYCRTSWPSDSAYFKWHNKYISKMIDHDLQGTIEVEVPLKSRHRADIEYAFDKRNNINKGHVKAIYNDKQVLKALYDQIEEQINGRIKDTIKITLENELKPIGIHYFNIKDENNQLRMKDIKHVEAFELGNTKNFNLTGELHSEYSDTHQDFKVVVIHPNRTVVMTTNYEIANTNLIKHRSKLEVSKTAWIGYNVELGNHSTNGNDSHKFLLELFYPKRTLATEGSYYMTQDKLDADVAYKWSINKYNNDEQRTVRTKLQWREQPLKKNEGAHQTALFTINHPYLEKNISIKGTYYRSVTDLLKADLVIDYSHQPEQLITMGTKLSDFYKQLNYTNYTFEFFALHPASELEVVFNATATARPSYYKTEANAHYQRNYYPVKDGKFLTLLDLNKREVEYLRVSPFRTVRFWAIPKTEFPVYGLNATIWDSPETNYTGYIYIDLFKKLTRMDFNLTEDASQNLQMVGFIPDTRSGYLDIWRNYEEIRIIDVASYFKMNHSRLITGRFHWRPKIKDELKERVNALGTSIYNSFSDGIDFWIKSLYTESIESLDSVWKTVKNYNQEFVNDIGELSVLEEDLEDLRLFLNQSYEANDFYIKTVVNFTLTILDELAIRNHIVSLPKIFTELWQAMGDSGKALHKSIKWLIETVKITYNNILDAISRFFHGESLHYLSGLLEKAVEKYDKFVKDLHISFIKYVENLWNKFWHMMSNYWKGVLKRFEPHVFKFMSYIEKTAWDLSKEIFDFIYQRTNELAESPYFNKVSSFTQDVDHLYKDIKSNDALTNIKKYSIIAWNFIKEKYFKLVPFGAELNEVLSEIWEEIKQLQKIEQVQIVIQKWHEIMEKIEWIAEELQFETRLHQLYALLRNKIRNYALNAIETADMYREAKTKFIFDPEAGIIDLEQKLPMSWHAFNETPKFEEIPEYKLLAQAQNLFSTTNSSLVKHIYNLRSHLDTKTWLPPYKSRALLIGSEHFMTFDKRFVALNLSTEQTISQCSYLLAHDFFQNNFTLMLELTADYQRKFSFVGNGELLEINLEKDSITINGNEKPMLPIQINGIKIYREFDVLHIQSDTEFSINCNIQFGLCAFEVSGWYFGQTAGILGTMNNEPFDEYLMPTHVIANDMREFSNAWSVPTCRKKYLNAIAEIPTQVDTVCNYFFKSGVLSACAAMVDSRPFYEICLRLGAIATPIKMGHPVIKGACTAALAYIDACTVAKIPMRVPDQCVSCQLPNGSYVPEGTFIELTDSDVPRSSDVVFIVEAKPCNANLTILTAIEDQLHANKIVNNRYAVIAFGGSAPFDKPRAITYDNNVFLNNITDLHLHFSHIKVSNGTYSDTLQAISAASKLPFRPGVSKTFILLSCSDCASYHMSFDYSSILQYMREEGVILHILADIEFNFEKAQKLRHFFGLDHERIYSKRFPEGDIEKRKQLIIPKHNLGVCTPLALETNGSVFSARKLYTERKYPIKRFETIFAKRVAKTAIPIPSQTCECSGHPTGVAYMACAPKQYPVENIDYDYFNNWEWGDEIADDDMDL